MYGLITRITATAGQREALADLLIGGFGCRPGCLSYIVALDAETFDTLWVTEVWPDEATHRVSFEAPEVRAFVARGWAMVATMSESVITTPVGGAGVFDPVPVGPRQRSCSFPEPVDAPPNG